MAEQLTWRQAREVLAESRGLGVNDAQQALDDLAHFADQGKTWSYFDAGRKVRFLRFAGSGGPGQPLYESLSKAELEARR
jgi:hypothetical protein